MRDHLKVLEATEKALEEFLAKLKLARDDAQDSRNPDLYYAYEDVRGGALVSQVHLAKIRKLVEEDK